MKVLVTGAAGFVGSHLARALVRRGDEVLAVVRPGSSRDRLADLESEIRLGEVALEDGEGARALLLEFRPEAVVHLAWYARPHDYLESTRNLDSLAVTASFVEQVFSSGCPTLVGVGTCLEYAPQDHPRRETDPVEPWTLYASTKLSAWLVTLALARRHGGEASWARLFHVHGAGEDPDRLLPSVGRSLRAGRPFDLSPGGQLRDHLDVRDVAAALAELARGGPSGIFNVCSGRPVTLREVLLTLGDLLGRPELLRFGAREYAPHEPMLLVGDPARLRQRGFQPQHTDLRASLDEAGYATAAVAQQ